MTPLSQAVGRRIRALRASRPKPLTQDQLAEACGISTSFLSMVERGYRVPHLETLVKISAALGLSLSQLLEGLEDLLQAPRNAPADKPAEATAPSTTQWAPRKTRPLGSLAG